MTQLLVFAYAMERIAEGKKHSDCGDKVEKQNNAYDEERK